MLAGQYVTLCFGVYLRRPRNVFWVLLSRLSSRVVSIGLSSVTSVRHANFKTSASHTQDVADLRRHRPKRKYLCPNYLFNDRTFLTREASEFLCDQRFSILNDVIKFNDNRPSTVRKRSVPFPAYTKGKQNTEIGGRRKIIKHGRSILSGGPLANDLEEDFEELQAFYRQICELDDINTKNADSDQSTQVTGSTGEEGELGGDVTDFSAEEPDDFEIEMDKAEEAGAFKVLCQEEQTLDVPTSISASTEEVENEKKRKSESAFPSEESTVDLPGHVDHDLKRRKLEVDTDSSQAPPPRPRRKARKEGRGKIESHHLFCRSSSLAAVFEAAVMVGALEVPQEESSNGHELNALDLELLGEGPSTSVQGQSSDEEDFKVFLGKALYPLVSQDDLRVAHAAANLLGIQQGNLNVSELDQTDREALQKAFGEIGGGTSNGF